MHDKAEVAESCCSKPGAIYILSALLGPLLHIHTQELVPVQAAEASQGGGLATACGSVIVLRGLLQMLPVAAAFRLGSPMEADDESDDEVILSSRPQPPLPGTHTHDVCVPTHALYEVVLDSTCICMDACCYNSSADSSLGIGNSDSRPLRSCP